MGRLHNCGVATPAFVNRASGEMALPGPCAVTSSQISPFPTARRPAVWRPAQPTCHNRPSPELASGMRPRQDRGGRTCHHSRGVARCIKVMGHSVASLARLHVRTGRIPPDFRDLEAAGGPPKSMYSASDGISETIKVAHTSDSYEVSRPVDHALSSGVNCSRGSPLTPDSVHHRKPRRTLL